MAVVADNPPVPSSAYAAQPIKIETAAPCGKMRALFNRHSQ